MQIIAGANHTRSQETKIDTTIEGADGERPCVLIDLFVNCILLPLRGLVVSDLNLEEIDHLMLRMFCFLQTGSESSEGLYKAETEEGIKFSDVYKDVQLHSREVHCACLKKRKRDNQEDTTPSKLPRQPTLASVDSAASDGASGAQVKEADASLTSVHKPAHMELQELIQDPGWMFSIMAFLIKSKADLQDTDIWLGEPS